MTQHHEATHDHAHWDTSVWPFTISCGILALALAFSLHFVYHNGFAAVIALGIGVPLVIAGIAGWSDEAMGQAGAGLSYGAMGWFILAEAMIFVAFFVGYWFMRLTAPVWPPEGTVALPRIMPLAMTLALVSSSLTMHRAEHLLHLGKRSGFLSWLALTIALGAAFIGMSASEWQHLMDEGFHIDTNVYGTVFFTITGFHGAHVIVGLSIFLAGVVPALQGRMNRGFWRTAGLYWHFVDIVWLFVVSQVYYW